MSEPVLEPVVAGFIEATREQPSIHLLGAEVGRKAIDDVQSPPVDVPGTETEDLTVPGGPTGEMGVRLVRPSGAEGPLPAVVYLHGGGWVFGGPHSHDRLVRELALGAGAAVVFVDYALSPEARYPTALEQAREVVRWVAGDGGQHGLDPARIAVAGDSAGGNMAAVVARTAAEHGLPDLAGQLLFYPATDAACDTDSFRRFADSYFLSGDAIRWCWEQYLGDADPTDGSVSPLRAGAGELAGLPRTLVITAEADVVRDDGELYATRLREAGVEVEVERYDGVIHDFVLLNALRETPSAGAAIERASAFLAEVLRAR